MPMKFNRRQLVHLSQSDCVHEEHMSLKEYGSKDFKQRFFRLKFNLLFYFKVVGYAQVNYENPVGVFVLEDCIVKSDSNAEAGYFSFSLSFKDDPSKKNIILCRSEDHVNNWIRYIQSSTYEYMRSHLLLLQRKISEKSGKDPLLMYPDEKKKITVVNRPYSEVCDYYHVPPRPIPPPRQKHSIVKEPEDFNLIDL